MTYLTSEQVDELREACRPAPDYTRPRPLFLLWEEGRAW